MPCGRGRAFMIVTWLAGILNYAGLTNPLAPSPDAVGGVVLGPVIWALCLPSKLLFYALAFVDGLNSVIAERVSGDEDLARNFAKKYEFWWTENPFFSVWGTPLFRV